MRRGSSKIALFLFLLFVCSSSSSNRAAAARLLPGAGPLPPLRAAVGASGDELSAGSELTTQDVRHRSSPPVALQFDDEHYAPLLVNLPPSPSLFISRPASASASTDDGGVRGGERDGRVRAEAAAPRRAPRLHLHAAQGQAVTVSE
jgi:hypothetical protein